jgi:hypothetical protein
MKRRAVVRHLLEHGHNRRLASDPPLRRFSTDACHDGILTGLIRQQVRVHRLGVPQQTREAFDLLQEARMLDAALADRLRKMVGFRNVAIHDYRKLNLEIVRRIVVDHLGGFLAFASVLLRS